MNFCSLTNTTPQVAKVVLQEANGSIEAAMENYFQNPQKYQQLSQLPAGSALIDDQESANVDENPVDMINAVTKP